MLFVLVFLGLFWTSEVTSNGDCNDSRDCGPLGFCTENNKCFRPFPSGDFCKDTRCKNNAKCSDGYGYQMETCRCDSSKNYGEFCQHNVPGNLKLASGFGVFFSQVGDSIKPPHVPPNENLYTMVIIVTTFFKGDGLRITVSTDEGFEVVLTESLGPCSRIDYTAFNFHKSDWFPYKLQRDCTDHYECGQDLPSDCSDYYMSFLDFPYRDLSQGEVFNVFGRDRKHREAAYLTKVTVVAKNFQVTVFNHKFTVIVNFNNLGYLTSGAKRFPEFSIQECIKFSGQNITIYNRFVAFNWCFINSKNVGSGTTDWFISKMPITDRFKESIKQHSENFQSVEPSMCWELSQGELLLNKGVYKIRYVLSSKVYTASGSLYSNYIDCYFRIQYQPLVVHLDGGTKRFIGKEEGIFISGVKSYDPNEPRENQKHVKFSWTCSPKCNRIIKASGRTMRVLPTNLVVGKTYVFTLTISAPGFNPQSASQEIVIVEGSSIVSVLCISNCQEKIVPTSVLLLQMKTSVPRVVGNITWTYSIVGEGNQVPQSVQDIYDNGYPTDLLCVKPDKLKPGKTYLFEATFKAKIASIKLNVDMPPHGGSCNATPSSGTAGKTMFSVVCAGFVHEDKIIVYEFYNKHKSEPVRGFNGKMIHTDYSGRLTNVQLTREVMVVFIYSLYGFPAISTHEISLTKEALLNTSVESQFKELTTIAQSGNFDESVRKLTNLIDILSGTSNKKDILATSFTILNTLLKSRRSISLSELKMGVLALSTVLNSISFNDHFDLDPMLLNSFTSCVSMLSNIFRGHVQERSVPHIDSVMVKDIADSLIGTIELISTVKRNKVYFDSDMNEMDSDSFLDILKANSNFYQALNDITYAVSLRQSKYLKESVFKSNSTMSSMMVLSDSLLVAGERVNKDHNFPIKFPKMFFSKIRWGEELTIQSTILKVNPTALPPMVSGLSTDLVGIALYSKVEQTDNRKARMVPLTILPEPFDIYLNVSTTYEHGFMSYSTVQLDENSVNQKHLDELLTMIRINVLQRCRMAVMFMLNSTTDQLRVVIQYRIRPTYDQLVGKLSKLISFSSSTYDVPYRVSDESEFMYIAVLPGPSTAVGKSVDFTLSFFCNTCLTRVWHSWLGEFCSVGRFTTESVIHCRCSHLSFFSAVFVVPPNEINPFEDFALLLTIKDNPFVAIYVVVTSLVFLVLCLLAVYKDYTSTEARQIIVLEDNFPGDRCFYVVAVFTGCRFLAGTRANVGIRLAGTKGYSRAHLLKSNKYKVLRYNQDDWFLISTSSSIGTINHIHVWHDCMGSLPDWYCEKILLYDTHSMTVYTFFAEEWIALDTDHFPEAILLPATADNFRSLRRIFYENLKHGVTHAHILASILARHRDVKMSRLDRIAIIWCVVLTASLIGIAFFKAANKGYEGIDKPQYSLGTKTFIKGTQVFFLNAFFIAFFQMLFKISYRIGEPESYKEYRGYERNEDSYLTSAYQVYLRKVSHRYDTFFEKFVHKVYKVYRPMTLMPVVLKPSSKVIDKKPLIYAAAWFCIIVSILLSSYFIVLYGLKMGVVKSKYWVSNIAVAMFNHFAVLVPLKIVLVAVILASHFVNLVPISNYKLKTDNFRTGLTEYSHDYVIKKRKSRYYYPMKLEQAVLERERRAIFDQKFNILKLVLVSLVILVLFVINYKDQYIHSNWIMRTVVEGHYKDYIGSTKRIMNTTIFKGYLLDVFVESDTFYRKTWYNKHSLSPDFLQDAVSWTYDGNHQLIGIPVLRQLRVVPNTDCRTNHVFRQSIQECIPPWSKKVMDTDSYSGEWSTIPWETKDLTTPWTYVVASKSQVSSADSVTGVDYPLGGYVAKLGVTRYETEKILERLLDVRWIDQYTRAVFGAATLYNVNRGMYTQVSIVAEHLPTGVYLAKIQAKSIVPSFLDFFKTIIYIVYVSVLVVSTSIAMNRQGLRQYLSKYKHLFQIILMLLGVFTIVFTTVHIYVSKKYISGFLRGEEEVVFNFHKIIKYKDISDVFSMCFFGCLVVRLFTLWSFGRQYAVVIATFRVMVFTLIAISTFLLSLCHFHWALLNLLHLFTFLRQDCFTKYSVTLGVKICLEDSFLNKIVYIIVKTTSLIVMLVMFLIFKSLKYKGFDL